MKLTRCRAALLLAPVLLALLSATVSAETSQGACSKIKLPSVSPCGQVFSHDPTYEVVRKTAYDAADIKIRKTMSKFASETRECQDAVRKFLCYQSYPRCANNAALPLCSSLGEAVRSQCQNAERTETLVGEVPFQSHACAGGTKYAVVVSGAPAEVTEEVEGKPGQPNYKDSFIQASAVNFYLTVTDKLGYPRDNVIVMLPHDIPIKDLEATTLDDKGREISDHKRFQHSADFPIDYDKKEVKFTNLEKILLGKEVKKGSRRTLAATPDDTVILYIASHGTQPVFNGVPMETKFVLTGKNEKESFVSSTVNFYTNKYYVTADRLLGVIEKMKFKHMLLVLDFCFARHFVVSSGGFFQRLRQGADKSLSANNLLSPDSIANSKMVQELKKRNSAVIAAAWTTEVGLGNNFDTAIEFEMNQLVNAAKTQGTSAFQKTNVHDFFALVNLRCRKLDQSKTTDVRQRFLKKFSLYGNVVALSGNPRTPDVLSAFEKEGKEDELYKHLQTALLVDKEDVDELIGSFYYNHIFKNLLHRSTCASVIPVDQHLTKEMEHDVGLNSRRAEEEAKEDIEYASGASGAAEYEGEESFSQGKRTSAISFVDLGLPGDEEEEDGSLEGDLSGSQEDVEESDDDNDLDHEELPPSASFVKASRPSVPAPSAPVLSSSRRQSASLSDVVRAVVQDQQEVTTEPDNARTLYGVDREMSEKDLHKDLEQKTRLLMAEGKQEKMEVAVVKKLGVDDVCKTKKKHALHPQHKFMNVCIQAPKVRTAFHSLINIMYSDVKRIRLAFHAVFLDNFIQLRRTRKDVPPKELLEQSTTELFNDIGKFVELVIEKFHKSSPLAAFFAYHAHQTVNSVGSPTNADTSSPQPNPFDKLVRMVTELAVESCGFGGKSLPHGAVRIYAGAVDSCLNNFFNSELSLLMAGENTQEASIDQFITARVVSNAKSYGAMSTLPDSFVLGGADKKKAAIADIIQSTQEQYEKIMVEAFRVYPAALNVFVKHSLLYNFVEPSLSFDDKDLCAAVDRKNADLLPQSADAAFRVFTQAFDQRLARKAFTELLEVDIPLMPVLDDLYSSEIAFANHVKEKDIVQIHKESDRWGGDVLGHSQMPMATFFPF